MKRLTPGLLFLCIACAAQAQAADSGPVDLSTISLLSSSMKTALDSIFNTLTTTCVNWLGSFILLQMVFTQGTGLLQGADWERAWAKFLGGLFWGGICVHIFDNGADFIKSVANYLLNLAAGISGKPFDPSYPIDVGISSAAELLKALDRGQSIFANLNPFPSIMMGLVSLIILATCAVISFRIFMISVETKIVIALSPISFALMGLNALRDQGFVPIKYLIAMAYRVLVLGAILAAMSAFSAALVTVIQNLPPLSSGSVWPPVWAAAIGYALLGALAWNSNAIAAQLASGSSSMTTADMGGPAAMASALGGALGGAVGGALASAAGSKPAQSMSDWMNNAFGDSSVGVKNASDMGAGGTGIELLKPEALRPGSMSMTDSGGGSGMKLAAAPTETAPDATAINDRAANTPGAGSDLNEYRGTPCPYPDKNARDPVRDAAREARRQDRKAKVATDEPTGSGSQAGIGGTGSSPNRKGFLDHLSNAHDQATSGQTHAVNVSLNTHHDI